MPSSLDDLRAALAGRYEIEREIGHGGMATVYLAGDVKHHRQVAVKVLRPDLTAALGPERFLREIEIAANLTHPHILPLYDSGEADGFLYYVMPYIEGDTLRERIAKEGELPVAEAVRIIREVVDALAFAHSHGVVHRDIKPDNVMLSGRHAMVTDFGVAKAISEATGRNQLTTAGVALGTPAYMSPEQATADPHVDHRSDIYAVGAMAYELLTGRAPFTGATPQAVLAAHVTEQAEPVSKHRDHVSGELDAVVMKCLEKKPADRWQSADELLPQLEALLTPSGGMTPATTRPLTAFATTRRNWLKVALSVTGVVLLGWLATNVIGGDQLTVTVLSNRQVTRASGLEIDPAISPDGREVAYVAGPLGRTKVFLQDTEGRNPFPLSADVEGSHRGTTWTPDGRRIVFTQELGARNRVVTVSRTGGQVEAFTTGHTSRLAISPDNEWIVQLGVTSISLSSIAGDSTIVLTDRPGFLVHSPAWSPDGAFIAYVENNPNWTTTRQLGNAAPSQIRVIPARGGEPVQIAGGGSMNVSPVWLPDGRHLLFISDREGSRDIYLQPVSSSGVNAGDAIRVTTGVGAHSLSISSDGRTVAYSAFSFSRNIFKLPIPASGSISIAEAIALTRGNQVTEASAVSRDGQWLAFSTDLEGSFHLYRMPSTGGDPERLTSDPGGDFQPSWSPNGDELAFHSLRTGNRDIFTIDISTRIIRQVTSDVHHDWNPDWSRLGDTITFMSERDERPDGSLTLYTTNRESSTGDWSEPRPVSTAGNPARRSPDGRHIAFQSNTGSDVQVMSADGSNRRILLTAQEVDQTAFVSVHWSVDGTRLYALAANEGQASMWSIPVDDGVPELAVEFDDPELAVVWPYFSLDGENFYLNIARFESDIWVMELEY